MSKIKQLVPEDMELNVNDVPPEQEEAEREPASKEWELIKLAKDTLWEVHYFIAGKHTEALIVGARPTHAEAVALIATKLDTDASTINTTVSTEAGYIAITPAKLYEYEDIANKHVPF